MLQEGRRKWVNLLIWIYHIWMINSSHNSMYVQLRDPLIMRNRLVLHSMMLLMRRWFKLKLKLVINISVLIKLKNILKHCISSWWGNILLECLFHGLDLLFIFARKEVLILGICILLKKEMMITVRKLLLNIKKK